MAEPIKMLILPNIFLSVDFYAPLMIRKHILEKIVIGIHQITQYKGTPRKKFL